MAPEYFSDEMQLFSTGSIKRLKKLDCYTDGHTTPLPEKTILQQQKMKPTGKDH